MLTLHPYQRQAVSWLLERPRAGLFLEPGLGKTVTTIVALDALKLTGEIRRVLLVAPLRVANETWPTEFAKWSRLHNLTYAIATGSAKRRLAAIAQGADVTIVNRENLPWLLELFLPGALGTPLPYDALVVDELSSFKAPDTVRFKTLRRHLGAFKRIIGLTGTPAPNSLLDLWPQMFVLDQGAALGKRVTEYRNRYFLPDRRSGQIVYSWQLRPGADELIYEAIRPTALSMRAADHLDLPARTDNVIRLNLPRDVAQGYREFARDQVQYLADDGVITAQNAAVLANKLAQYASGSIYDADGQVRHLHDVKIDAVCEIVESLQGSPALIFYSYRHERDRLLERIPGAQTMDAPDVIARWNRGEIPALIAHPASAGHGLNLQDGGHTVIWYGPGPWSLELYAQANARVDRQGQTKPVVVHRLVCAGTVDYDIARALDRKEAGQAALMDAMRAVVASGG